MPKGARENDPLIKMLLEREEKISKEYKDEIKVMREEHKDEISVLRKQIKDEQDKLENQREKFEREKLELEEKCEMKFEKERELLKQLINYQNNQIVELKDENKQLKEEIERLSRQKPGIQIENKRKTSKSIKHDLKNIKELKPQYFQGNSISNERKSNQFQPKMSSKSHTFSNTVFVN